MAETLDRGESDYVLLLDDDAICEPEAIVRAVRFADAASTPTIVGGGMIHIDARTVLYAQSEQWDTRIGWVDLSRAEAYDHDFARTPFRSTPFAHRRHRSDFNGWWMCLIPVSVLRAQGLSLPLFLKGDDVEFGLRAKARWCADRQRPGHRAVASGMGRQGSHSHVGGVLPASEPADRRAPPLAAAPPSPRRRALLLRRSEAPPDAAVLGRAPARDGNPATCSTARSRCRVDSPLAPARSGRSGRVSPTRTPSTPPPSPWAPAVRVPSRPDARLKPFCWQGSGCAISWCLLPIHPALGPTRMCVPTN